MVIAFMAMRFGMIFDGESIVQLADGGGIEKYPQQHADG
jgi:hypothetical protein